MKIEAAYYVGTNSSLWRAGIPLRILGVVNVLRGERRHELCYHVIDDKDGVDHYFLIEDELYYQIISKTDLQAGRVPVISSHVDYSGYESWGAAVIGQLRINRP